MLLDRLKISPLGGGVNGQFRAGLAAIRPKQLDDLLRVSFDGVIQRRLFFRRQCVHIRLVSQQHPCHVNAPERGGIVKRRFPVGIG